ncbi:serine protease [Pendulispora rubella]|uniref:Serine protease n=1 Tax=Pendulispora rubella TaxID=2741070 RepID=A0ABZ2KSX0_9BACT
MIAYRLPMRVLLAAALLTAAGGCSSSDDDGPSGPADIPQFNAFKDLTEAPLPIQTAAQAVVRIQTAGSYATGSFISAEGLLLTNNHVLGVDICAKEGCYARITRMHQLGVNPPGSSESIFVEPQHVDVGLDMAVLQAYAVDSNGKRTSQRLATPQFLNRVPRDSASLVGTHVNVVGHPEGKLKKWTSGDVAQANGTWFKSTAFILPGNSGSPLLDDAGNIVGLLHRGPTAQDLVTKTGINVYSIGTSSAAIEAAMNAPLPAAARSLTTAATADDIVEHQAVYLNGHVSTVQVITEPPATPPQSAPKDVLSLLGAACDKGLDRTDFDSPDDLAAAVQPCYDALDWITCSSETPAADYQSCPKDETKAAWTTRFQRTFDAFRAMNGQLFLDMLTYAPASLQTSASEASSLARNNLQSVLAQTNPPLDFSLSTYLAIYGIQDYAGTNLADYTRNYTRAVHYELAINSIALTALWLNRGNALSTDETKNLLARLAGDEKASLGQKLYLEEIRYNSGLLTK